MAVRYGFDVYSREGEPFGSGQGRVVMVNQVHGSMVRVVEAGDASAGGTSLGDADAMVTNQAGLTLVVKTGDCVPVLFWDKSGVAIGIAHAGWRGILAGVVLATIAQLRAAYGVAAADLQVMIGPAICGRHYDVSETTDGRIEQFEQGFSGTAVVLRRGSKVTLGLRAACVWQCKQAGIAAENVRFDGRCTFEDSTLPSHRRQGELRSQNLHSWILIQ